MTLFSESFFVLLIVTALVWTAVGGVILLWLLIRDAKRKQIW